MEEMVVIVAVVVEETVDVDVAEVAKNVAGVMLVVALVVVVLAVVEVVCVNVVVIGIVV